MRDRDGHDAGDQRGGRIIIVATWNVETFTVGSRTVAELSAMANLVDVLGDFNRRFNIAGDDMWAELDDGDPDSPSTPRA